VIPYFGNNESLAKDYWLELIDNSLTACSPFGFVSVQWEWAWMCTYGYQDYIFQWFESLLENPLYTFWTYEAVADWFNVNFDSNPAYRVAFTSPFDNSKVEWYHSDLKRVCRYEGKVVNYVDYSVPFNDKYRTDTQVIAWGAGWEGNEWNCVDISLYDCIKIDALGGGYCRFEGVGEGQIYSGDLADFGVSVSAPLLWYHNPLTFGIIILGLCVCLWILWKIKASSESLKKRIEKV
jgi:hypothetical protein